MSVITIFACQFAVVFLLGIQSQMVRDANCTGAAVGSLLIGFSQFFILSIVGGMGAGDMFTPEGLAFLVSGPLAIVTSIKTHPYMVKHLFRGHK